jgi:hypothetical protein
MALISKLIKVEAKIGDEIKAPISIFNDNVKLYICHIEGDLLFFDTDLNSPKDECEAAFAEDCHLV